jgi:hypothetical protein
MPPDPGLSPRATVLPFPTGSWFITLPEYRTRTDHPTVLPWAEPTYPPHVVRCRKAWGAPDGDRFLSSDGLSDHHVWAQLNLVPYSHGATFSSLGLLGGPARSWKQEQAMCLGVSGPGSFVPLGFMLILLQEGKKGQYQYQGPAQGLGPQSSGSLLFL